jgi:hypothetical protein
MTPSRTVTCGNAARLGRVAQFLPAGRGGCRGEEHGVLAFNRNKQSEVEDVVKMNDFAVEVDVP